MDGVGSRGVFLLSASFSNRNKSFKNQHTRRGGVRRSKDAPSIIGRNLFAHLFPFPPTKVPPVFHPISNRPSYAFVWGLCIFHGGRDGETWMAYLFCLLEAQRNSRRRAEGMNGDDETPSAMRSRVVSTRAVSRSERVTRRCWMSLPTILFIYLERRNSVAEWWRSQSVEGETSFFSYSADWRLCWIEFIYRACLFLEIRTRRDAHARYQL